MTESLTDEQLLKFLIAVVDAELFKTVFTKNFKSVDIENTNDGGVWNVGIGGGWVNGRVHLCYDPREQPVVESLKYEDILTISSTTRNLTNEMLSQRYIQ